MIYYKTSQPVPGKGDAWMYYECNGDQTIRRYLTYIPATGEIDRVAKPFIKRLQRPEILIPADQQEFEQYWPPGEDDDNGLYPSSQDAVKEYVEGEGIRGGQHFDPDMTIGEAMAVHPQVAEVFAAFHLGGCSSCGVGEYETVAQVCMAYGVDLEILLDVLEGLMDQEEDSSDSEAREESAPVD